MKDKINKGFKKFRSKWGIDYRKHNPMDDMWTTLALEKAYKQGFKDGVLSKMERQDKVTRVEVISKEGRELVKYDLKNVYLSWQDNGKTLKIFLNIEELEKGD